MMKFAIGALLSASACLSSVVRAECSTQSVDPNAPSVQSTSEYENVGLYQWDEAQQAWVLIRATYEPFYETEAARTGDEVFSVDLLAGGGGFDGGDGGGDIIVQGAESDPSGDDKGRDKNDKGGNGKGNQDDPSVACDLAKKLDTIVVTGSRPQFGSLQSLMWRNQLLNRNGGGGAARRPVPPALNHPDKLVRCSDDARIRVHLAQQAVSSARFGPARFHQGMEFTIQFQSGMRETFVHLGAADNQGWLSPKLGTCVMK